MVKRIEYNNIVKYFIFLLITFTLFSSSTFANINYENDTNNHNNRSANYIYSSFYKKNILIYIISDRTDSDGWYTTPLDVQPIVDMLTYEGLTVDVKDEVTLPKITLQDMENYSQIWILEGDSDEEVEVSQSEADDLFTFYENGGGVWISWAVGSYDWRWTEDALVFANRFFVYCNKFEYIYGDGKPVYSSHYLFEDVNYIWFASVYGCISSTNPNFESIWSGKTSCTGIGIIDSIDDGRGRCIFDSGWMIGNAYCKKYDDLVFARNAAHWLKDITPPNVEISKPKKAFYLLNTPIREFRFSIRKPLIIGKIDIEVNASDKQSGIDYVEFYVDGKYKAKDENKPYTWQWKWDSFYLRLLKHRRTIKVIAYDNVGNSNYDEMKVWRFF